MSAVSDIVEPVPPRRSAVTIWLLVGAGLLLLVAANAHLVIVAFSSQPPCVAHVKAGAGEARKGGFGAAQSSCTPSEPPESPKAEGKQP